MKVEIKYVVDRRRRDTPVKPVISVDDHEYVGEFMSRRHAQEMTRHLVATAHTLDERFTKPVEYEDFDINSIEKYTE